MRLLLLGVQGPSVESLQEEVLGGALAKVDKCRALQQAAFYPNQEGVGVDIEVSRKGVIHKVRHAFRGEGGSVRDGTLP